MQRRLAPALLFGSCFAALGACSDQTASEGDASRPGTEVRALTSIEEFDLPSPVSALALIPANSPFRSRGVILLEDGSLHLLTLALGELATMPDTQGKGLTTAANFQLRGEATPLVLTLDPTDGLIRIQLLLAEENTLLSVPAEEVRVNAAHLCTLRDTPAQVEIAAIGEDGVEVFEIRDRGGEALSIRSQDQIVLSEAARLCVETAADAAVEVTEGGIDVTGRKSGISASLGGATVAGATMIDNDEDRLTLVSLPARGHIYAETTAPNVAPLRFTVEAGVGTDAVTAPGVMAASTRNFGGSYNDGVALLAQANRLSILSLDSVTDAMEAIDPMTQGSWSEREAERSGN